MGISVDIASPDTDIDDLREVVEQNTNEDIREALYEMFAYGFGQQDTIEEEHLEAIIEFSGEYGLVQDASSVEELRIQLDSQKEQIPSHQLFSELVNVSRYVLLNEDRENAVRAQKEAIANDWDMSLTVPVL
jgi:hypothetical protein